MPYQLAVVVAPHFLAITFLALLIIPGGVARILICGRKVRHEHLKLWAHGAGVGGRESESGRCGLSRMAAASASRVHCCCCLRPRFMKVGGTGALHLNNGSGTPNKGSPRRFYWMFFLFFWGNRRTEKPQIWVSRRMEQTHWALPSPRPATRSQPSYANPPAAFVGAAAGGGRGNGRRGDATASATMADEKRLRHREYVKRSYNKKIVRNADHMDNDMRMHSGR